MTKKSKLQNILNALSGADDKTSEGFKAFDAGVSKLKSDLKEKIQIATLDDVNSELDKFKKKIDYEPLLGAVEFLKQGFSDEINNLSSQLEAKTVEMAKSAEDKDKADEEKALALNQEIDILNFRIADVINEKNTQLENLRRQLIESDKNSDDETSSKIAGVQLEVLEVKKEAFDNKEEVIKEIHAVEDKIPKVRAELVSLIVNKGGGNMNRQIFIGGVDPLKRYTDINLKAGSNVTITYVNNDQTKKVDVTFASSGGGGGSVRSINSVSTPTLAGSAAGTDYVYLVSGNTTITLPTAVGNTNLYTIKNVGSGTVTIAFTGAETGDGSATLSLPVQYTAVDLISDTVNWNIT